MKTQITASPKAHLIQGTLCMALLVAGRLLSFFPLMTLAKRDQRTLTFAERVAYQRAIEEVYWRHRIWPKENANAKPSLGEVMSAQQIEKKVEDYLRDSQALEEYWQKPITAEQLQAEMDRMARDTRQPEVLRELFDALGDDPFVIAECLVKPILTERLIADLSAQGKTRRFESSPRKGLHSMAATATFANVAYALPTITKADIPCTDDTWTPTDVSLSRRYGHIAVWTGSEMIVWGGTCGGSFGCGDTTDDGARYNPATDSWTPTSTTNQPTFRYFHTAVWTGSEMIVWSGNGNLNTGGRYNPTTDSWTTTSTTNAPVGRWFHTAVWTGNEMIVWGGQNSNSQPLNTGGRYNPSTDSWIVTSRTNAPEARSYHTAVWSGDEMIVWGGDGSAGALNTGGRYNPGTNSWTVTSTTNVSVRESHTAVWTGSEMIVWGGDDGSVDLNTGSRYNPSTDTWTVTSTTHAPAARNEQTAVWTGSEMVVWGGFDGSDELATGGRYDPVTDTWVRTSTANGPQHRIYHTAVWTGYEMIVWGGFSSSTKKVTSLDTGGRYCAQSAAPSPTPTVTPTATPTPTANPTPTPIRVITPGPRPTPRSIR
jgi:N-acetylneuraminic acid mutarotase